MNRLGFTAWAPAFPCPSGHTFRVPPYFQILVPHTLHALPLRRAVLHRAPFYCATPPSEAGAAGLPPRRTADEVGESAESGSTELVVKDVDVEVGSGNSGGECGHGHHGRSGGGDGDGDGHSDGSGSDGGSRRKNGIAMVIVEGRHIADKATSQTGKMAAALFKFVPPQVLTALIGLASGYGAQQRNNTIKQRDEETKKEEERKKRIAESEKHLRELYDNNHGPLLKAAAKLSERIYVLVSGLSYWEEDAEPYDGAVYSAFLVGKYFGLVEHIKRNSRDTLSLGFPASDRILLNILGRIQSSFGASDAVLRLLQSTEASFKHKDGKMPVWGGPVRLTPRSQVAIGELMWRDRVCGGSDSANIVSFSEFAERMDSDHQLGRWMQPVIRDLKVLRKAAIKAHKNTRGSQNKQLVVETSKENATKYIGSRLYVLQNALVDLVEFLDPAPFKTIRPDYRKRLQLAEAQHAEQMRMPPALLSLYEENAKIRDRVVSRDDPYRAFRGKPIELFLKAGKNGEAGDCPYSQRVQMSLCLMGLDYNTVPVDTASKPGWFHILSGESQVPVIFTNGTLIAESRHIMSFLIEKYPKKAKAGLGPATHKHGRIGTMSYTRFFPAFKAALSGRAGAVEKLQHELRVLNETLAGMQMSDRSGVFLGGKRFSREDTSIVPMLHAVDVAGIALKGKSYGIPDDCGALKTYLAAAREQPCFIATAPSREATIEGYGHLVDREKEFVTTRPWLQDLLE